MIKITVIKNAVVFLMVYTGYIFSFSIAGLFGAGSKSSSPSTGSIMGLCNCLPDSSCRDKSMKRLIEVISTLKETIKKYKSVDSSQCIDSNTLIEMGVVPPTVGTECLDLWLNSINPFKILSEPNTPKLARSYNTCYEFHKSLLSALNLRLSGGYDSIQNYLESKSQPNPLSQSGQPCLGAPSPLRSPFSGGLSGGSLAGMASLGSSAMCNSGAGSFGGNSLTGLGMAGMGEFRSASPCVGGGSSIIDTLTALKSNQCGCNQSGFSGSTMGNEMGLSGSSINLGGTNVSIGDCCESDLTTLMARAIKEQRQKQSLQQKQLIMQQGAACPVNVQGMKSIVDTLRMEAMKQAEITRQAADASCYPQTKISMGSCCEGCETEGMGGSRMNMWNTNLGVPSGLGLELGAYNNPNISMGQNSSCPDSTLNNLCELTAMQTFGCC